MYLTKVIVRESPIEGEGVFALEDIKKGMTVWKFVPTHDKALSISEFEELDEDAKVSLERVAYLSAKTNKWIYPPEEDPARFTNHNEANNLSVVFDETVSEEMLFIANQDIQKGEELTVNYLEFDTRPKEQVFRWG